MQALRCRRFWLIAAGILILLLALSHSVWRQVTMGTYGGIRGGGGRFSVDENGILRPDYPDGNIIVFQEIARSSRRGDYLYPMVVAQGMDHNDVTRSFACWIRKGHPEFRLYGQRVDLPEGSIVVLNPTPRLILGASWTAGMLGHDGKIAALIAPHVGAKGVGGTAPLPALPEADAEAGSGQPE